MSLLKNACCEGQNVTRVYNDQDIFLISILRV